eukprot:1902761-Rhodomonas_salina.1
MLLWRQCRVRLVQGRVGCYAVGSTEIARAGMLRACCYAICGTKTAIGFGDRAGRTWSIACTAWRCAVST